jgi:hypothetical protein
LHNTPKNSD